jgi:hypothetical protein
VSERDEPARGGASDMERGYARSRAKAEAIRADLHPLGPDERPLGLKLAVALAIVLGGANVVAALGAGALPFAVLIVLVTAGFVWGLWTRRYTAILLFQALLALTIIVSALALLFAGNLLGVLLCVGLIVACAPVFWLLVRVMARLQVPPR